MKRLKIVGLIFSILMVICGTIAYLSTSDTGNIAVIITFAIISCWITFRIIKPKRKKTTQKDILEAKNATMQLVIPHLMGLSVPENTMSVIYSCTDKYEIIANGITFNLEKSKITDISIKTDVEIQKETVSSVGGAIAGNILLGPLGAVIGGRAKTKEYKNTTYCLIFTYIKDNSPTFIAFDTTYSLTATNKLIKEYKSQKNSNTNENISINL